MGAGILPVAMYRGTIYVLLGQERFNGQWSDFGGSALSNEYRDRYATAIREGSEELNGLFGIENDLRETVKDNLLMTISNNDDRYTSYVYRVDYDKMLPLYFERQNRFIEKHLTKEIEKNNGLFEKSRIRWFKNTELLNKTTRPHFRNFYECIVHRVEWLQILGSIPNSIDH